MHWSFDPVGGAPFTLLVGVVLVLLVWLVPPSRGRLTRRQRGALVALRLAFLALVLLTMVRPSLQYTRVEKLRATLVLLLDSSRSMQVEDSLGDASRWRSVVDMLGESREALEKLSENWDVAAWRFDTGLTPVAFENGTLVLPETPDGDQTGIGAALSELTDRVSDNRLLGVVLVSDGAQRATAPRDLAPQLAARRLAADGAPLYGVAVGSPASGGGSDLAIEDLSVSDTLFAQAPAEVTARLRIDGYSNRAVSVQLLWEDDAGELKPVDAQRIETDDRRGGYPIRLRYTPTRPGEQKIVVRVEPLEGEQVTGNNEAGTFVTVREGGVRVLYLAGATRRGGFPGVEQRFVRAALDGSPDIAVQRRMFNYSRPPQRLEEELRPGAFEVFVLDNLDKEALELSAWRALADRVREGAGLIMVGGYHSFGAGGHASTPMADLLPIGIGPLERQNFGEPLQKDLHVAGPLKLRPTRPFGLASPVTKLAEKPADSSAGAWGELPPLLGANRLERSRLKPNAQVLLETDDAAASPILVDGQPGAGRVLALAGDSTWRWVLGGFEDAHRRFWRQVVLWLAKKDDREQRPVWIELASRRVPRGGRLEFETGAAEAEPGAPPLEIEVTVEGPDGQSQSAPVGPRGDRFAGVVRDTGLAGDYRVRAVAKRGDDVVGETEARFLTPASDLELDRPAADPALLAQLAQMTAPAGGRLLAAEELPALLAELAQREPELEEEVVARITLWDNWPVLLAMVTLLGVEWWLRKRWGLA
ncbi:hypothetical protein Pla175_48980 [Pirellulimonas nuda]|uniref:Glutamine amidotransferase domain-containing protein n=1 Tax=Pirellulimonas nuda TaxID=2528009 RepID=A0A518DJ13_9BACT|nr:hypothetical protein [Pirellulimonas nuda]QDU91469.1 hypothetical protein Pla175_48980 [Pirellulimonas nuda]